MKRVFIHIGLPKTATSTMQTFLYYHGVFLHKNGYHYIETGLSDNLKCHHDMIWKLGLHKAPPYIQKDIGKHREDILDKLATEERRYRDKDLIISSELLTFLSDFKMLIPLLQLFVGREVKFVFSIRRQDYFLESLYQQVVKDGVKLSFAEWLSRSRDIADYDKLIDRLLYITHKRSIIINRFDKNINPIEEFLISIGVDRDIVKNMKIKNTKENESLSKEQVEKIRESNSDFRSELLRGFKENSSDVDTIKAIYLDDPQRERLLETFRESNRELIERMNLGSEFSYLLYSRSLSS